MVLVRNIQEVPASLSNSTASLNSIDQYQTYYKYNQFLYNTTQMHQQQQQANTINTNEQRTVYLGDLDMDINEKQLHEHFNSLGIATTKITKQAHSSYAHVTFASVEMARKCLDATHITLPSTTRCARVMPFNQPNTFDPNANLIIKNLEAHLTESDIIEKMRVYGDILSCKLVRDERTGESKCYSYLQYKDAGSAAEAIDKLNNTYWDEKCDPDYKYRMFQERLAMLKSNHMLGGLVLGGKLHESDLQEHQLFADFANHKMGKKIYVGLFKKKDEYSRIKSDKEGKPSNLYVKNFGTNFGDRDLFNLFKAYGSIKSAKVRRLKTGLVEKPLGCGFVDFENPEEAERARQALNNYTLSSEFGSRVISVTYADCKNSRIRMKLDKEKQEIYLDESSENLNIDKYLYKNQTFLPSELDSFFYRKSSSESTYSSKSNVSTTSIYNEVVWNKILGTNKWTKYNLF